MLMYETHSHTPLCKHACGEPEFYAEAASNIGLNGIIVTCHNPMPDGYAPHVRMGIDEFERYLETVARAHAEWAGRVDVRLGLECDYFPGFERWLESQIRAAPYDYLLGSVHPQTNEFRAAFWTGDSLAFQKRYFLMLSEAAETGWFDCLAHPDLVKNEIPDKWRPYLVMNDIRRALDRIAATGIAMELNTSGLNKNIPEMNPFPDMLREMKVRDIPVVIGSDAHVPERVGDGFSQAIDILDSIGYSHVCYFLERQRHDLSIDDARDLLHRRITT